MNAVAPNVVVIPANPDAAKNRTAKRQLRVAAYCRVSTDDEEQLTSYEAQYNGPPVKTTKRKNIVNHSVSGHRIDFAADGRA